MIGRDSLVDVLWNHVLDGHTVLIHGSVGIGKTTVLDAIAERAARERRPCGRARRTVTLGDVTRALAGAYPDVDAEEVTQRRLRGRLRLAVELQPGVLLLDDLREASTALKGFLRALRGTGLGVILAGDAEHPRDHARLRGLGLSYREIKVPPLAGRHMAKLFDAALAQRRPFAHLTEDERAAVVRAAAGRPGWLVQAAQLLCERHYFSGDRVRLEILRSDIAVATSRRLMQTADGLSR